MTEIWKRFGFTATPYSRKPLEVDPEDARLFVGRLTESAQFMARTDSKDGCVVVLSGQPGVGKTSFLNVHQHWMAGRDVPMAKCILPSYKHVTVSEAHVGQEKGLGALVAWRTVKNVEKWCGHNDRDVPEQTRNIQRWLSHEPDPTGGGWSISLPFVGGGHSTSVSLPAVEEATLYTWENVLAVVAEECRSALGMDGVFACLDNAETLSVKDLARVLMELRDNLLDVSGVWWVLVGPANLFAQLTDIDTRVAQRIKGPGVEIPPMSSGELFQLVEERVQRYRDRDEGASPLSPEVHDRLFTAARGVARFALSWAEGVVEQVSANVRVSVMKKMGARAAPDVLEDVLDAALRDLLFEKHIPDKIVNKQLEEIVVGVLDGMGLSLPQVNLLEWVGTGTVSTKDEVAHDQDLEALAARNVLQPWTIDGRQMYRLRNEAYLCADLGAFQQLKERVLRRSN